MLQEKIHLEAVKDALLTQTSLASSTRSVYSKLVAENGEELSDIALVKALTETLSFYSVLKVLNSSLNCYHKANGKKIKIEAIIADSMENGLGVAVLEGKLEGYNGSITMKWYKGDKFDITREMKLYEMLYNEDKTLLPWFSLSYRLWTDPVLVIRTKTILSVLDHELDVGISLLSKLKKIHRVCIHCDIKPGNIVKDEETNEYYLIDFGQSSFITEKRGNLHDRYVHTNKYYRSGYKNSTSIKTDLLELLYTMRQIQINRTEEKKANCHNGFKGALKKYYLVLDAEPEYPDESIYNSLINILSKNR
jgi:serine/threonine protein kinase